ncbi:MAG TPA: thiamine pyrophosphate-binding protein [Blastocatellia bacterium]|nr:thiamine pyrophosphate-binding protein [Blastocatellia bacterium]
MAEMNGAQAMYEMMVREQVRYVFGNPGTTELPLMDLFAARSEIDYILALHEDSALAVAAGYADASRRAAVVNLHTNPGLAHALGNLYNAQRAGTPLVVTAGQQDTHATLDEPLLCADMVGMARPFTKWAYEVHHATEIPAAMARAFKVAETPPTGPVFLSLPVNAMEERADIELLTRTRIDGRGGGDPLQIEAAAALLAAAKNPAIIAGDGCARSQALFAVAQLAEMIAARVYAEPLNALLDFPTGHPLFAGPLVPNARQSAAMLEGVDVILTVGATNLAPLVYTGHRMIPASARLIQIDLSERELGKNFPAEVAIQGDPRLCVEELLNATGQLIPTPNWEAIARREKLEAAIREGRARFAEQATVTGEDGPMSAGFVARILREMTASDAILVDEAVTATTYLRLLFEIDEVNSYFFAKGGSLGFGLPFAVGVKLARPDRQVICAVGDGSALYAIQGLWTAARYRLGVVFVVFNNSSYQILKGGLIALQGESARRGQFIGMDITEPEVDFRSLAESLGVAARRVSRAAELRPAIEWALSENRPTLLDVAIARDLRSLLR